MPGMGKQAEADAHGSEPRWNHLWLLLLIAAPAAVEVWSGWIGLGSLSGFGEAGIRNLRRGDLRAMEALALAFFVVMS